MPQTVRTHYDNLQIARTASDEVIRGAYRYLCQRWHPDKHPDNVAEAERVTKLLNEAYYTLSDPQRRREHDEWIASQEREDPAEPTSAAQGAKDSAAARGQLSDAARNEYARSIARGRLVWSILVGFISANIAVFIIVFIVQFFDGLKSFFDKHDWILGLAFLYFWFGAASEAHKTRIRKLLEQPDDVLAIRYAESSRVKTVLAIVLAIALVGIALVGVMYYKRGIDTVAAAAPDTSAESLPPRGDSLTKVAAIEPAAPTPSPGRMVLLQNECEYPVRLQVALPGGESDYQVYSWNVAGSAREEQPLQLPDGKPFFVNETSLLYYARTSDADAEHQFVWQGNESEGDAVMLTIGGQDVRFKRKPAPPAEPLTLHLSCQV